MATRAVPLGVVLAALAGLAVLVPSVLASPSATWQGTTDTLVCVDGTCHFLGPPVDDASVKVGTAGFREVRLTLDGPKGSTLALSYLDAAGHRVMTRPAADQTTAWIKAPSDRVLEVTVVDVSPIPDTGLRPGVSFELTAVYR